MARGTRHEWAEVLMQQGFSYREALRVIDAIIDAMKGALRRHEPVELPFGTLRVLRSPEGRKAWRLHKVVNLFPHRYRVVLEVGSEHE